VRRMGVGLLDMSQEEWMGCHEVGECNSGKVWESRGGGGEPGEQRSEGGWGVTMWESESVGEREGTQK